MFATGPCDEGLRQLRSSPFDTMNCNHSCASILTQEQSRGISDTVGIVDHEVCLSKLVMEENSKALHLYDQGDFHAALAVLYRCLEATQSSIPSAETLMLKRHFTTLMRNIAHIHYVQGMYEDSLHFSMEALQVGDLPEDELTASLWFNIGNLLWLMDKGFEEAECALSRSLQILDAIRAERNWTPCKLDRDIVSTQTLLLLVQGKNGLPISKRTEAMSLLRLLNSQRGRLGYENETVAKTLCALGTLFMRYREPTIATRFLMESMRVQESIPKEISDNDKLMTLTQLGQSLQATGHDVDAMGCFREALRLKGKSIVDETAQVKAIFATVLYNIGMIQSSHGDRADPQRRVRALHSFRLCLDLRRRALGNEHPAVASALHNIGILLLEDGQVTKSLDCFQESLQIRRKAHGPRHHEVASSLRHIGRIHQDRGEYQEALRLHQEALVILRQHVPTTATVAPSEHLVEVLMGLGHAHYAAGNMDQALKAYEDAANLLRQSQQNGHRTATQHIVRVLNIMGNLSLEMADTAAADGFFAEAAKLSGRPAPPAASRFPAHAAAA